MTEETHLESRRQTLVHQYLAAVERQIEENPRLAWTRENAIEYARRAELGLVVSRVPSQTGPGYLPNQQVLLVPVERDGRPLYLLWGADPESPVQTFAPRGSVLPLWR